MVRKVLKWKDENKDECEKIYSKLDQLNYQIFDSFQSIDKLSFTMKDYFDKINEYSRISMNNLMVSEFS
jgi:phosphomevalonate kinase